MALSSLHEKDMHTITDYCLVKWIFIDYWLVRLILSIIVECKNGIFSTISVKKYFGGKNLKKENFKKKEEMGN